MILSTSCEGIKLSTIRLLQCSGKRGREERRGEERRGEERRGEERRGEGEGRGEEHHNCTMYLYLYM